jgi:DnaJ-class molecular chaperone
MRKSRTSPKRGFLDGYQTYDDSKGHGSPKEWRAAFNETMGIDEANLRLGRQTPWQVLGITRDASWADVMTAYKAALYLVHPDRCAIHGLTVAVATERSKLVIAAFTLLKERRS